MSDIGKRMDEGQARSLAAFTRSPLYASLVSKGATPTDLKTIHDISFKSGAAAAVANLMLSVLDTSASKIRANASDQVQDIFGVVDPEPKAITDKNGKVVI